MFIYLLNAYSPNHKNGYNNVTMRACILKTDLAGQKHAEKHTNNSVFFFFFYELKHSAMDNDHCGFVNENEIPEHYFAVPFLFRRPIPPPPLPLHFTRMTYQTGNRWTIWPTTVTKMETILPRSSDETRRCCCCCCCQ